METQARRELGCNDIVNLFDNLSAKQVKVLMCNNFNTLCKSTAMSSSEVLEKTAEEPKVVFLVKDYYIWLMKMYCNVNQGHSNNLLSFPKV